ncbi:hypothetical protein DL546_000531 [Coniochaeta pulveracea]|uniref:BHLH domain-containing protein n=1 Tax=Coniochaeta pulveracea TaxID=177199 RepID=A0A420Y0Z9_9PEZI|nr:hypothetical protein DL546_000531 [Coniochaeta pulveracea]
MPQPTLLPTPVSSTDISAQDGTKQLASLQTCFELPPAALAQEPSPAEDKQSPPRISLQASESVKSRRRSSAAMAPSKDQFTLPPPPTRTRKIIQMKPRAQQKEPGIAAAAAGTVQDESDQPQTTTAGNKRKQAPSATSAAGRKMARKTAHSLIERRRRSKMNEEFGTLKDMVPACTGEMHKLAILQATIEYVRYLEDCITQLKAQNHAVSQAPQPPRFQPSSYTRQTSPDDDDDDEEEEATSPPPAPATSNSRTQHPSASPIVDPQIRKDSISSASSDHRDHSYSVSATTSPAFGPQYQHRESFGSALTSPALEPQRDLDHEVTSALLTLSQTDRRAPGYFSGRGMSVRDLLTP